MMTMKEKIGVKFKFKEENVAILTATGKTRTEIKSSSKKYG